MPEWKTLSVWEPPLWQDESSVTFFGGYLLVGAVLIPRVGGFEAPCGWIRTYNNEDRLHQHYRFLTEVVFWWFCLEISWYLGPLPNSQGCLIRKNAPNQPTQKQVAGKNPEMFPNNTDTFGFRELQDKLRKRASGRRSGLFSTILIFRRHLLELG